MPLTIDEQTLLSHFRRLTPEGKSDILNQARLLAGKSANSAEENNGGAGHCTLERKESRPEAAPEPIFTE
ncbi:MAG TPA: hypothetical protein VFR01_01945 [Geobacterales bacterium]|nr:hypothetical protein [Geobacterales bacterium]